MWKKERPLSIAFLQRKQTLFWWRMLIKHQPPTKPIPCFILYLLRRRLVPAGLLLICSSDIFFLSLSSSHWIQYQLEYLGKPPTLFLLPLTSLDSWYLLEGNNAIIIINQFQLASAGWMSLNFTIWVSFKNLLIVTSLLCFECQHFDLLDPFGCQETAGKGNKF